jgi:type II secretion system protein G
MLTRLRERMGREEGFTLIELLVVMLILGILAAIAIPTFFNQRDKAQDAEAKVNVRAAETAMETYRTDNGGSVAGATSAIVAGLENTLDAGRLTVEVDNADLPVPATDEYFVRYSSDNGPNTFTIIKEQDGDKRFDCATRNNDGCPTDGNWGQE